MFPSLLSRVLSLFLLLALLAGCGQSAFYDQRIALAEGQWTYEDSLHFDVDISDTSMLYHLYLDVEHSAEDYPFQNIYLNISTRFPDGQAVVQQLSPDFADPTGRWHGDCRQGTCLLRIILQENAYFEQIGRYALRLEQYTRSNPLPGIEAITLRVEQQPRR